MEQICLQSVRRTLLWYRIYGRLQYNRLRYSALSSSFSTTQSLERNKPKVKKNVDWLAEGSESYDVHSRPESEIDYVYRYKAKTRRPFDFHEEDTESVVPQNFGAIRFDRYNQPTVFPSQDPEIGEYRFYQQRNYIRSYILFICIKHVQHSTHWQRLLS